jgi:threonine dehydrogenase-like Zn-dependent dehydrogenase
MRAARFYGKRDMRVEDIDYPPLTEGKVYVDIEWCGICGSVIPPSLSFIQTSHLM